MPFSGQAVIEEIDDTVLRLHFDIDEALTSTNVTIMQALDELDKAADVVRHIRDGPFLDLRFLLRDRSHAVRVLVWAVEWIVRVNAHAQPVVVVCCSTAGGVTQQQACSVDCDTTTASAVLLCCCLLCAVCPHTHHHLTAWPLPFVFLSLCRVAGCERAAARGNGGEPAHPNGSKGPGKVQ